MTRRTLTVQREVSGNGMQTIHHESKYTTTTTTTTVLRPFVRNYPGEPVPEETLTHPPYSSSSNLYQLLPSTTIHSILHVQSTNQNTDHKMK